MPSTRSWPGCPPLRRPSPISGSSAARPGNAAGDWATAAAHYRQALELNPNLLNAHYRLATIEGRLGHSVEAAAHRKRWQELHEARSELRQAFGVYFDAQQSPPQRQPRAAGVPQTTGRRSVGPWAGPRAAEGWSRLAVP